MGDRAGKMQSIFKQDSEGRVSGCPDVGVQSFAVIEQNARQQVSAGSVIMGELQAKIV